MRITCDRQRLVIAFTAVLVGFGLIARPFGIVGLAGKMTVEQIPLWFVRA